VSRSARFEAVGVQAVGVLQRLAVEAEAGIAHRLDQRNGRVADAGDFGVPTGDAEADEVVAEGTIPRRGHHPASSLKAQSTALGGFGVDDPR
jgi:hypothetical protein